VSFLGVSNDAAVTGLIAAFLMALIMVVIRRRRLGATELALYWFAFGALPGILIGQTIARQLENTYLWTTLSAYLVGFLLAWLLFVLSAWVLATRRPGLTGPALAIYWLGVWLPWLWTPLAYFSYSYYGWPELYVSSSTGADYTGYIFVLILAVASGIYLVWRYRRRHAS